MIGSLVYTLIGINLLAYAMVALRPKLYRTTLYKPMLLNIKLSILPLLVLAVTCSIFIVLQAINAYLENITPLWWLSIVVATAGLLIWVLLLPNSGYLITELNFNHRDHDETEVPLWYDIVGVLALAMSGVMNMCFNVFIVQFIVAVMTRGLSLNISFIFDAISWIIMIVLMLLTSFGIYLGRYIRFNSWDVKHPRKFIIKLKDYFADRKMIKNCLLFILFHTLFFAIFYCATVGVVLEELISSINIV